MFNISQLTSDAVAAERLSPRVQSSCVFKYTNCDVKLLISNFETQIATVPRGFLSLPMLSRCTNLGIASAAPPCTISSANDPRHRDIEKNFNACIEIFSRCFGSKNHLRYIAEQSRAVDEHSVLWWCFAEHHIHLYSLSTSAKNIMEGNPSYLCSRVFGGFDCYMFLTSMAPIVWGWLHLELNCAAPLSILRLCRA